jgi:hypothetical protein
MSKSKELDNSVTNGAGIRSKNIDAVITKAAHEVESRFVNSDFHQVLPIAPQPEAVITTNSPPEELYLLAPPDPHPSDLESRSVGSDQLELDLDFTNPSPQTKLILNELKYIESKLNSKLNAILEYVQKPVDSHRASMPTQPKSAATTRKAAKSKV